MKLHDEVLHLSRRALSDENIIHIDKDVERVATFKLEEEKNINFGKVKSKLMKQKVDAFKPGPKGLLESIQSVMEFAYPTKMRNVNKLRRLNHIDIFLKNVIKEGIVKIKLSHKTCER